MKYLRMRWIKTLLLLLLGAALGALAGLAIWFSPVSTVPAAASPSMPRTPITPAPAPVVDAPAPDFSLPDLEGLSVRLSELRGYSVIINFWASWCQSCKDELPLLDRTARDYSGALRVLAVNTGESAAVIRSFMAPLSLTAITVLSDSSFAVHDLYFVIGLPTSFFVDTKGVIRSLKIGPVDSAELQSILLQMGVAP
jgi:cytochrome c biogenesis protein CcmG/thiol:disulfide interchange protein DsbE